MPLLAKQGGQLLKQEADDLFGMFRTASQAIETGLNMLRSIEQINQTSDPIDQMGLSVGVDYGRFLHLTDDAYGDPINVAFKLAEDIAKPGEVLVGAAGFGQAQEEGWTLEAAQLEGPVHVQRSAVSFEHYILRL